MKDISKNYRYEIKMKNILKKYFLLRMSVIIVTMKKRIA